MKKKKRPKKYDRPVSLYPLKPEEAIAAFLMVNPDQIKDKKKMEAEG